MEMKCSKARKWISEYVDGLLPKKKKIALHRHLGSCGDCQELLRDFQAMASLAKELDVPSPSREVWLKIQEAVQASGKLSSQFSPEREAKRSWFDKLFPSMKLKYAFGTLSALVFLVAIGALGIRYWKGRAILAVDPHIRYGLAKLEEAQHHYQKAIEALSEAVQAQRGQMDPQIEAVFRQNLELLDSSIKACAQMVKKDPGNLDARNYLLAAYREKLNFLDGIVEAQKLTSPKRSGEATI